MSEVTLIAIDIAAIGLLVFALYFPRHRRRDLVVAYLGVNVGVMAVATALSTSSLGTGVGLGLALFGVLSIIRLRSTELDQHEVAYYFSALALGLLAALGSTPAWRTPVLMALILAVMFIGDHPRLFRGHRRQSIMLDSVFSDQVALVAHLEQILGARVHSVNIQRVDMVNDTTLVDVRYSGLAAGGRQRKVSMSEAGAGAGAGAGASR